MDATLRKTKVTIGTGDGHEVETTLGEMDDVSKRLQDNDRLVSPLGIGTQLASKDDYLQAIRNASREIARAKQDWKTAKEMEAEAVEHLDEWLEAASAKEEAAAARETAKEEAAASEERGNSKRGSSSFRSIS